ncbi:rRNA maturation RNase YbeY [Acidimangrovimonas sediminis]|uniref:rRNA maturation RNase YbeY n=1 Tax=Acidimangrovimonas sediminis TaxID=2056283 RepID=UPI001E59B078|nr:rRNA maturation RNase YbeY [Acidimangrovimonas sediminis]
MMDQIAEYSGQAMLDIAFEDSRWEDFGLAALAGPAVAATLAAVGLDAEEAEATLLACDDARIAGLNAEFRDKPTPTNVLSWPAEERAAEAPGTVPALPAPDVFGTLELGDMAIAWETCAREALEQGKPMADHVTHLVVHATLHLLGYDHVDDEDAALMEGREVAILATLGIADPYGTG